MKKTLLITIDFPPQTGGVANYLSNFSQNLPADKIVVLANKTEHSQHFDGQQKYKIIREKLLFTYFWPQWLKASKIIKNIIAQEKTEQIIISHVLPMGYIALILNLPFIVILHGYDIVLAKQSSWKKYWLKKILSKSKHIIVNSHFTENQVLELGIDQEKTTIVYPCPNISPKFLNETEKQIILHDLNLFHKKILLSVGRLVNRKGFDLVIKSLPEVIKKIPNLIYLIVGNGPERKNLEELTEKLRVADHVTFLEDIKDSNLPCYYDLANIFIMPTRTIENADVEGFGIVYLEANLFGKPVIAAKTGGVQDAVIDGQTGILVSPENVQEITQVILRLFNDPNLMSKLGTQGKNRVLQEFQWPIQTAKIKDLL